MPAFTLGRLAKLYGFHRSSVYEAVAKGRVSAGFDGNGQRVIDLAEAIRVWGEPQANPTAKPDTATTATGQKARHPTDSPAVLPVLLEELRLLREGQEAAHLENKQLREDLAALRKELAGLRVALLEHKPEGIEEGAAQRQAGEKKSETAQNAARKPAKSFADLLKALPE